MPEITLKVTADQFNMIQAALNAFVVFNQQSAAILNGSLQSQANAQIQPVATIEPPKA